MPKKKESSNRDSSICANCGMASEDWSEGYKLKPVLLLSGLCRTDRLHVQR